MVWAIIKIYTAKCAQMDPQQLPKRSKFYSKCKKCDIEKTLGGWVPPPLVARRLICYLSIGGAKSVASIDTGAKILTFRQIRNVIISLPTPKGGKLHCQLRWGAMAGFAPLDPPLLTSRFSCLICQ